MDAIRHYSMLISGEWVDAADQFETRSPATEELVATVAKGGAEQADRAVLMARAAHEEGRWRRAPPADRAAVVPTLAGGIVRCEPVGVSAASRRRARSNVPWNFPLLLAIWKIDRALSAGNTIVVKSDERTPLTLLEFARIAQECGLPPACSTS